MSNLREAPSINNNNASSSTQNTVTTDDALLQIPATQRLITAHEAADTTQLSNAARRSPRDVTISTQRIGEFRTLLEAAEQVVNASHIGTENPQIRRLSTPATNGGLGRISLTRRYSGRPHVPGEDSGSEGEDADDEDREQDNPWAHQDVVAPGSRSQNTPSTAQERQNILRNERGLNDNEQQVLDDAREHIRSSEAEVRRAGYEIIAQRETSADEHRAGLYERLNEEIEQSERRLQDLQQRTDALLQESEARARSSSTSSARRWRPSERLQDYANNTARREVQPESDTSTVASFLDRSIQDQRQQSSNLIRRVSNLRQEAGRLDTTRENGLPADPLTQRTQAASRDLDQALERYRIVRRALRQSGRQPTRSGPHVRSYGFAPSNGAFDWLDSPDTRSRDDAYSVHDFVGRSQYTGDLNRVPDLSSALPNSTQESTRDWAARRRQMLSRDLSARASRSSPQQVDDLMDMTTGPLFTHRVRSNILDDTESDRRRWRELMRTLPSSRQDGDRTKFDASSDISQDGLSKSLDQAKAVLAWLARLRKQAMSRETAWEAATEAGLHNFDLEQDAKGELAMSVDELPLPTYSSWLQPGTRWRGTQSAENALDQVAQLSNYRQRYLDGRRLRQDRAGVEGESRRFTHYLSRGLRDPLENVFIPHSSNDSSVGSANNILEIAERSLSDMLERTRQHINDRDDWEAFRGTPRPTRLQGTAADNTWNVSITLHSVDWENSTVTGTMSASELPGQKTARTVDPSTPGVNTSMDSFFTGEIIDFHRYGLDTVASSPDRCSHDKKRKILTSDYSPGGPQTDLLYWSSLPPFRAEVEKANETQLQKNIQETRTKIASAALEHQRNQDHLVSLRTASFSAPDPTPSDLAIYAPLDSTTPHIISNSTHEPVDCSLTPEQLLETKYTTMTRLLSDSKWLNRNLGSAEFILMRWKERCFVSNDAGPNPSSVTQMRGGPPRHDLTTRLYSTVAADRVEQNTNITPGGTWGLTISGFYYVSLNRRTGSIEGLYYDASAGPFQKLSMEVVNSLNPPCHHDAEVDAVEGAEEDTSTGTDAKMNDADVSHSTPLAISTDEMVAEFGEPGGGLAKEYRQTRRRNSKKQKTDQTQEEQMRAIDPWRSGHVQIDGGLRSSFGLVEFK